LAPPAIGSRVAAHISWSRLC